MSESHTCRFHSLASLLHSVCLCPDGACREKGAMRIEKKTTFWQCRICGTCVAEALDIKYERTEYGETVNNQTNVPLATPASANFSSANFSWHPQEGPATLLHIVLPPLSSRFLQYPHPLVWEGVGSRKRLILSQHETVSGPSNHLICRKLVLSWKEAVPHPCHRALNHRRLVLSWKEVVPHPCP